MGWQGRVLPIAALVHHTSAAVAVVWVPAAQAVHLHITNSSPWYGFPKDHHSGVPSNLASQAGALLSHPPVMLLEANLSF